MVLNVTLLSETGIIVFVAYVLHDLGNRLMGNNLTCAKRGPIYRKWLGPAYA